LGGGKTKGKGRKKTGLRPHRGFSTKPERRKAKESRPSEGDGNAEKNLEERAGAGHFKGRGGREVCSKSAGKWTGGAKKEIPFTRMVRV